MSKCINDNALVEFVEGTLGASDAAALEKHVARCVSCRKRLIAVGASPSRIAEAPTAPAGIGAHLTLEPGARIDRFEVCHEIGHGGMGVVFAARDSQLERSVALKLLHSASSSAERASQAQQRLLDEARAMARLDHPNIITVYEAGTFQQETYIVMELVHGETLNRWLVRWNRPWTSIVDAFKQAGRALAHAHEHGIAHGDFKPENVLVDDDDRVRVTDFGLARWFAEDASTRGQVAGQVDPATGIACQVVGTPRYMAPEQFTGRPADARSDQFSFCVALYEALFGEHPFAHANAMSVLRLPEHKAMQPLRSRRSDPSIPAWLYDALARGLSPSPRDRYASMTDLLEALCPPPLARPRPRNFAMAMAAGMSVVSLMGYALGAWQAAPSNAIRGDRSPFSANAGDASDMSGDVAPSTVPDSDDALVPVRSGDDAKVVIRVISALFTPSATMKDLYYDVRELLNKEIHRVENRLRLLRGVHDTLVAFDAAPLAAGASVDVKPGRISTKARPRARARRNGLSRRAIKRSVKQRWRDLEICFSEWRERQPSGGHSLVTRVQVNRAGRGTITRIRGLRDRVVRKCVSGAIEAVRFPRARRSTQVRLKFRTKKDKRLVMSSKLIERD